MHFLRIYISSMPAALEKMQNVSEETLKEYIVTIHGVKGISETICAEEVASAAKQLEEIAKNNDLAGVLALNGSFIMHAEKIVDSIRSWLTKKNRLIP